MLGMVAFWFASCLPKKCEAGADAEAFANHMDGENDDFDRKFCEKNRFELTIIRTLK